MMKPPNLMVARLPAKMEVLILQLISWIKTWSLPLKITSVTKIIKFLGETGNNVMMRLMGLIVMVIAVEFFFSGLKPIIQGIIHS